MILRDEMLSWLQMKPDVHLKSASVLDTQWERSSCCICRWSQFQPLPMMHSLTGQVPWIFPGGGDRTYNHCLITWVKEAFSKKCNVITLNLTLIYLKYTAICLNLLWLKRSLRSLYLFVEFVTGPECIQDRVLVVRCVEIKQVDAVCFQPLQGGLQLGAHALWLQSLPIPGVGLGS